MVRIKSLYPIPGSKSRGRYDFIQPLPFQKTICEPFMGGAAKSLQTGLKPILGEINPSLREIAFAPTDLYFAEYYVTQYNLDMAFLLDGLDIDILFKYKDVKQSQKVLRKNEPLLCEALDNRWRYLLEDLFYSIERGEPKAGTYSFIQRGCFGNVVRLTPKGTHFNVTWHVNKLCNAIRFKPNVWVEQLQAQKWNPTIYSSWEQSIEAAENPVDTWLFLDPPYVEADGDRKMSSAYPGHVVTGDGREETYRLAIEPLEKGLERGFLKIDLCNYYSERLENDVSRLAEMYEYSIEKRLLGECSALGNSNGRFIHGKRASNLPKPIECIWTLKSNF